MNYIVGVTIALGLLIFVHELGHFLLAKRAGVGVKKFSLGFGPKIIGKKWGETEYLISAFPLGGYVNLEGENPGEETANRDKSFNEKPPLVKLSIAAAGPIFNILFAILIIAVIYALGITMLSPFVAEVENGMPAASAGLKYGDVIVAIDGNPIYSWDDMTNLIHTSGGKKLEFTIMRDNRRFKKTIIPAEKEVTNIFGEKSNVGLVGIRPTTLAPRIGEVKKGSLAERSGFKPGDLIKKIGSQKMNAWNQLKETDLSSLVKPIKVAIQREKAGAKAESRELGDMEIEVPVPGDVNQKESLVDFLGIGSTELYIEKVEKGYPADLAGLKPYDKIVRVNGKDIKTWTDFEEVEIKNPGKKIEVEADRGGEIKKITLVPKSESRRNMLDEKINVGIIGVYSANLYTEPKAEVVKFSPPKAVLKSVERTGYLTVMMFKGIGMLATGKISSKNISGPIAIAKMAGDQAKKGAYDFAFFVAFISINLGIINFIPLGTITDGGLILLFIIEWIIGKQINMKLREVTQYIGIVLIVALMGFAIYNDFTRYLGDIVAYFGRLLGS